MKKSLVLFSTLSAFLMLSNSAEAAKIAQVKDKRVLINLEGESTSPGSEFFVLNTQGKKVALVVIKQVKGDKALGEISKGTAKPGYSMAARGGAGGASTEAAAGSSSDGSSDSYYERKLNQRIRNGNSFGVVGSYLMNSMTATFIDSNLTSSTRVTASMAGSGFGALGYYDYMFSPSIAVRGMAGVEQFKLTGSITTPSCSGTLLCTVDLTYMSFYGYGRWIFLPGKYKSWIGGGFGYLYAVSKASSVLKQDQISANQIFTLAAGVDIRTSAKNYIPVSLEYGLFPSSDSVKASIIYLRAGFAWNL